MRCLFCTFAILIFVSLNFAVADTVNFEDAKFCNEILPLIQENMDSPGESIHMVETNQGRAIVSIVATPNKLLKSNPTPNDKLNMFTITLNKGKQAISRFLQSKITSETEIVTSSQSDFSRDQNGHESKAYERNTKIDDRSLEQSSMVLLESKGIAHWFTGDNQLFKRAVVFIPNSK